MNILMLKETWEGWGVLPTITKNLIQIMIELHYTRNPHKRFRIQHNTQRLPSPQALTKLSQWRLNPFDLHTECQLIQQSLFLLNNFLLSESLALDLSYIILLECGKSPPSSYPFWAKLYNKDILNDCKMSH